jgi:peroxisomal trans-2-enoyl-CoA reductase
MSPINSIFRDDLFKNKVAIITGGGTGIGLCIAEELAKGGAKVVIASRKMNRLIPAAKGLSRDYKAEVVPMTVNIRELEAVEKLFDDVIEKFGRVDYVVNNGGGQFFTSAEAITERGWKAVVDTNLNGTWNMCSTAGHKWMLKNGGKIVTIVADMWRGFPGMAHTGAARAGIVNMAQTLAVEWADKNIQVNCVAPGTIISSGMNNYPPSVVEAAWKIIPAKRLGKPEEISSAVCFLLSPAGDFITGETIKVDGGGSLWGDTWPIADPQQSPDLQIQAWPEDRWPEFAVTDETDQGDNK